MPEQKNPSPGVTVETAAIRIGATIFTLPRPNRHHNIIWWLSALGIRSGAMHDQGFVLSDGRYAGREEAATIALAAGQLEKLHAPPRLFSEDLWDGGADLPSPEAIKAVASPSAALKREEVARIIYDHLGFNVLTDDLIAVNNCANAILARLSPLASPEKQQNQEHTLSISRSGGSPTTSVKSDSPHSAGGCG